MSNPRPRSAAVTAAATLALLISTSALLIWGIYFRRLLNMPADDQGKYVYQTHTGLFFFVALVPSVLIAVGLRTGIGLFQLRNWARISAMCLASIGLLCCLALIALRPFETFFFPNHFVSDVESLKQMIAISFLIMLLPVSIWWLFLFRTRSVKLQFQSAEPATPAGPPTTDNRK